MRLPWTQRLMFWTELLLQPAASAAAFSRSLSIRRAIEAERACFLLGSCHFFAVLRLCGCKLLLRLRSKFLHLGQQPTAPSSAAVARFTGRLLRFRLGRGQFLVRCLGGGKLLLRVRPDRRKLLFRLCSKFLRSALAADSSFLSAAASLALPAAFCVSPRPQPALSCALPWRQQAPSSRPP